MSDPDNSVVGTERILGRGSAVPAFISTVVVIAVLYVARDVLVPITLALFLGLLVAPFVRGLRRAGFGHTTSVIVAVAMLMGALAGAATIMLTQIERVASSLPQYEQNIQIKLRGLEQLTRGGLTELTSGAERAVSRLSQATMPGSPQEPGAADAGGAKRVTPIPVQVQAAPAGPWQVLRSLAAAVWGPLATAGIVLVVLIFVLLEHEALRDRFIRLTGSADIRAATTAMIDAELRLSRFFTSQFLVNLSVAAVIGVGLALFSIPEAPLWAALTLILRFVPFIGVWIVAVFATLLAGAVAPDWTPALWTICVFVLVELVAGQFVEPYLYGHSTGLSPLTVVVAAIFWSWLWGPIGLIVSTPLTLCLLVAGKHTRGLRVLEVILGDTPALTMPQRFYQRALSGDSEELIFSARNFLIRNSFAEYCDVVIIPALQLAATDHEAGVIVADQEATARSVVLRVIAALGEAPMKRSRRRHRGAVLGDSNVGRVLRREREGLYGRWQGPIDVPEESVVLCVSVESEIDELVAELLTRVLRLRGIDARHFSSDDLDAPPPPGASPLGVSFCYIIDTDARADGEGLNRVAGILRKRCPAARLVSLAFQPLLNLPGLIEDMARTPRPAGLVDLTSSSFVEALHIWEEWQEHRQSTEKNA